MKKQSRLFILCMAFLMAACAETTVNIEMTSHSESNMASSAKEQFATSENTSATPSDEMAIAIAKELFKKGDTVFWWYHSGFPEDLEINPDVKKVDDVYLPVGKFKTVAEMKSATEEVFTSRFCEKILYPWGTGFGEDEDGNAHYKEIGGVLYYNSQMGGMGWNKAFTDDIAVKSKKPGRIVVTATIDELMLGTDRTEKIPYDFILLKENGTWKLDNWYEYNHINDSVKDFQKYLNPVLGAGILNTSWKEASELNPDLFVSFATYKNLEEQMNWFDAEGKYEITSEKNMLVPAKEVEAYILPCFDIQPEQVRASRLYVVEKDAYIIGGIGGVSSAVANNVDSSGDGYSIIFYNRYHDAMRVSEGSLRIMLQDEDCRYLSNSAYVFPEAPRESVDDVVKSAAYDPRAGELRFSIPEQIPEGYKLYLHIAESLKMDDGQMSFHAFEDKSESCAWEPGKTYTQKLEANSVNEIIVTVGLLAQNDPTLVLNEIELRLDSKGNRSFASDVQR